MSMKCPVCGKEIGKTFSDERCLKDKGMCFSCDFWKTLLEEDSRRKPHTWCVIDGTHYVVGSENDSGSRGFGGDKFVIRFHDGTIVTTTNLWCQGEVDDYWKSKFPNNADFDWQWKKIGNNNYLISK